MLPVYALVLSLTWTALLLATKKNPLYPRFLFSKEVVEKLIFASSLTFAPGLLEVMKSSSPPSIDFFKSLPSNFHKRWGVYVITLERVGSRPRIYVGSGTGFASGVWTRIMDYIRGSQLPVLVKQAQKDGYTITHKGLLVWSPIPLPAAKPETRLLFVSFEAVFHFVFWSMVSKTSEKGYHMRSLCPWSMDSIQYDGCNTHNPFDEHPFGDFDLSPEEREAHTEEIYQRQLDLVRRRREEAKEDDLQAYNDSVATQSREWRAKNPTAAHKIIKRYEAKNIEEKRHHCSICNYTASRKPTLTRHEKSEKHIAKAKLHARSR
jgi:hypothetical protein